MTSKLTVSRLRMLPLFSISTIGHTFISSSHKQSKISKSTMIAAKLEKDYKSITFRVFIDMIIKAMYDKMEIESTVMLKSYFTSFFSNFTK